MTTTLSSAQIEAFIRDGHVTLRQAIPTLAASRMLTDTWDVLKAHGIQHADRATWPAAGRPPASLIRHPTFQGVASTQLGAAIDDLLGTGRWQVPLRTWGFFRLSWPDPGHQPWELVHDGWHWDASPLDAHAGLFVLIHIGETVPGGGGTLLVSGSHRLLVQRLAALPPGRVKKSRIFQQMARTHPWLSRLITPPRDVADAARRREELMRQPTTDADGHQLQVVESIGQPGDVTLCHPSILHAVNLNRADRPRIMRLCSLGMRPGMTHEGTPRGRSIQPLPRAADAPQRVPTVVPMPPAAAASSPDLDALVSAVLQGERSTRDAARLALRQAGSAAIPALERRLSDPRWRVRRLVAQLLDNALDERSLPVLERALGDCNAVVRRHSLHSLVCEDCKVGRSWPVDLAGVLLGIIEHDRSRRVRVAALKHLARRPAEPRAIAPLQRLIASRPHPRVQDQAQRVLDGLQRSLTAAQGPGNAAGDGPLT